MVFFTYEIPSLNSKISFHRSLIDFVYPGRLGSLQEFTEKIGIPITQVFNEQYYGICLH